MLEPNDDQRRQPHRPGALVHGQWSRPGGEAIAGVGFGSDTANYFREKIQRPWFESWLHGTGRGPLPGGVGLRERHQHVAHVRLVAAAGRRRRASCISAPTDACRSTPPTDGRVRPLRLRSRAPGALHAAPDRWLRAGGSGWSRTSASSHNRPDVLSWETEPLDDDLTIAGNIVASLFASTTGTRCRLGGEADRRLPGQRGRRPDDGRVSADGGVRRPARALPQELLEAGADSRPTPCSASTSTCTSSSTRSEGPPHHGAGAEHLVPALRSQPADVRAEHLQGEGRPTSTPASTACTTGGRRRRTLQ